MKVKNVFDRIISIQKDKRLYAKLHSKFNNVLYDCDLTKTFQSEKSYHTFTITITLIYKRDDSDSM